MTKITEEERSLGTSALTSLFAMKVTDSLSGLAQGVYLLGDDVEGQLTTLASAVQLVNLIWAKSLARSSDITMQEALNLMHNMCSEFTNHEKLDRLPRIQLYE